MSERVEPEPPPEHVGGATSVPAVRERLHWGYREVLALVAVGVLAQILSVLLGVTMAERLGASGTEEAQRLLRSEPLLAVPVQFVAWLPVLAYVVLVVRQRYGMPLSLGLAWTRPPASVRTYVRLGILLALGSLLASIAIGDPEGVSPMQELFANRGSLWILAVFGVLVAPVFEEIVFRGFLFAAFEYSHGTWTALVLTSVIFALLHGAQYGWHWQQLTLLLAVGGVLGSVRIRSGSSRASTIVHATYNGLLFLVVVSFGEQLG